MGRKSLAKKIYETFEEKEKEAQKEPTYGKWILIYDFPNMKPSKKFWYNLHRLKHIVGGTLIQYSVFETTDEKSAYTAIALVTHYDGMVACYKVDQEIDISIINA